MEINKYAYDANRRLTSITDPMQGQSLLGYNERGQITSLTDAKGNVTSEPMTSKAGLSRRPTLI